MINKFASLANLLKRFGRYLLAGFSAVLVLALLSNQITLQNVVRRGPATALAYYDDYGDWIDDEQEESYETSEEYNREEPTNETENYTYTQPDYSAWDYGVSDQVAGDVDGYQTDDISYVPTLAIGTCQDGYRYIGGSGGDGTSWILDSTCSGVASGRPIASGTRGSAQGPTQGPSKPVDVCIPTWTDLDPECTWTAPGMVQTVRQNSCTGEYVRSTPFYQAGACGDVAQTAPTPTVGQVCGRYEFKYTECTWERPGEVQEVYQNSCGDYSVRNKQFQAGVCGHTISQPQPQPAPAPRYSPPVVTYTPPVYQPPVYNPPAYNPPVYTPPVYVPPTPPAPVCRSINCPVPPDYCKYEGKRVTYTCDPYEQLTCGTLMCEAPVPGVPTPRTKPPTDMCQNISCPQAPDHCRYVGQITFSCDSGTPTTCGRLECTQPPVPPARPVTPPVVQQPEHRTDVTTTLQCPSGFSGTINGSTLVCVQNTNTNTNQNNVQNTFNPTITQTSTERIVPVNTTTERVVEKIERVDRLVEPRVITVPAQTQPQVIIREVSGASPSPSVSPAPAVTYVQPAQPKVVEVAGIQAKELPKTGVPIAAFGLSALLPIGLRLRRFGSFGKDVLNANFIWEERQLRK